MCTALPCRVATSHILFGGSRDACRSKRRTRVDARFGDTNSRPESRPPVEKRSTSICSHTAMQRFRRRTGSRWWLRNLFFCPEAPMGRTLVHLLAAALVAAGVAWAIDPHRTMSQYVVQSWGVEQGLSRGVYSIGQTANGYLVVAARNGLLRFDGFTFVQMHSPDIDPLFNRVVGLVTDAQGVLWLRLSTP